MFTDKFHLHRYSGKQIPYYTMIYGMLHELLAANITQHTNRQEMFKGGSELLNRAKPQHTDNN